MTDEIANTRRAPHMEQYVRIRPYQAEAHPEGHKVELVIGVQGFPISDGMADYHESKEAAEWCRDMLCIALNELRSQVIEECVKAMDAEFASDRGGYDPSREYTAAEVMEAYYTAGHRAVAAVCKLRVKT